VTGRLLTTKLYAPQVRSDVVVRPRLGYRLNDGMGLKLTLVSAPAGFGKSTLLSDWIVHRGGEWSLAWISLEEADNDLSRFLSYLIAALQTIEKDVGETTLASLRSPQPPPIESLLVSLINELALIPDKFVLVLDDYHVIEARPVHDVVSFLLEHMPPRMHLVIASRTDPPLQLARLRARHQMIELRAADLCFTPEEAGAFLTDVMRLDLSTKDVEALERRTEGWIAGLQLAALSMRGRKDVSGFIEAFTGSNRYILDYLVEEVLAKQPDAVSSFLLKTSILLDRMSGELCDAVTQEDGGQQMLEKLERENLFVFALDDDRHWYRYHHLFAEVLRHHLRRSQSEFVPELHQRASRWYEQNELIDEAIRHTLEAEDFGRAADLVEQNAEAIVTRGEAATLLRWLETLPKELVRSRPRLCVLYAWEMVLTGQLNAVESLLQAAEGALNQGVGSIEVPPATQAGGVLADVPGTISILRGTLAQVQGDIPRTIELSRQALARLPKGSLLLRKTATWNLGNAYLLSGDLSAASQIFAELSTAGEASGDIYIALLASYALARVRLTQGRLREAAEVHRQALQLSTEQGKQFLPVACTAFLGMSEVLYEWNDLAGATHHVMRGTELSKQVGDTGALTAGYVTLARIRQAEGDVRGALDAVRKAEQSVTESFLNVLHAPMPTHRARLWIAQGNVELASRWAREVGLSADDELSYPREAEHIALARVLMAQDEPDEALGLLERLLAAAKAGGRTGSVIEILALQALALQAQGASNAATPPLVRALSLAEPEGYVRTFVDEGPSMSELLRGAATGSSLEYTGRLLTAFHQPSEDHAPRTATGSPQAVRLLSEPLSERELEVLRLVAAGKSNREISGQLFVTVDTVKKHLTHIFGKLGVRSRTQAVARARELGLIR
jgi:LuxR family maltose regulon positive regulatory protein